jgi:hypothetical protein
MRQRRVAGTEDAIGRHVGAKLLLHRVLHVDVAQHAEAFRFQRGEGLFKRLVEADAGEGGGESVHGVLLCGVG